MENWCSVTEIKGEITSDPCMFGKFWENLVAVAQELMEEFPPVSKTGHTPVIQERRGGGRLEFR